jgi:hypothetical protein
MIDGTRPDPSRCNITSKCRGKLTRVGESSIKQFLFTPPVEDLQDYVQRGKDDVVSDLQVSEKMISVISGANSIALLGPQYNKYSIKGLDGNYYSLNSNSEIIATLYKVSPDLIQYKKYTFSFTGNVHVIQGSDNSLESKNLRFTKENDVRVFVNGVELSDTAFDRSVDNVVTLTPAIYETNNVVEVLVYSDLSKIVDSSEKTEIQFKFLSSLISEELEVLKTNAWGVAKTVKVRDYERRMMFCKDLSSFTKDYRYIVKGFHVVISGSVIEVDPSELCIMFGFAPYKFVDAEFYSYLWCKSIIGNMLEYSQDVDTGITELKVGESLITHIVREITVIRKNDLVSQGVKTTLSNNQLKHKYILGPT